VYKYVATRAGRSTSTCLAPIHPETSRTFVSDDVSRFTSPAMESSGAGGQLDVTFVLTLAQALALTCLCGFVYS
jgi:hypothetical protein